MKKTLRFLFLLLLAVVWGGEGFAADVTVDFSSGLPSGWNKTAGTVTKQNYQKVSAVQLQKNTTIESPSYTDKTFSNMKIKLTRSGNGTTFTVKYQIGSNTAVTLKSFSSSSVKSATWADYSIAIPEEAQTENVKFIFTSTASSYYISTITLTEKVSDKTATTLTFPKSSYNLIDGEENDFEGQLATVTTKDGKGVSTGTITYTADDPNGILEKDDDFATNGYALLKGEKTYGTAKITATYTDASNTYESSTASYTVTYSPAQTPVLSFSSESVTVKQGEESKFVKPTIKFTDEKGEDIAEAADIIYTVSPEDVVTIDDNGDVTDWLKPGEATITATTSYGKDGAGKDVYYDASYKLIYEKQKIATTLAFDKSAVEGEIDGTIAEMPVLTLTAGETVLTGKAIEYTSSNTTVATVDKATGALTLLGAGEATITATFVGDDDYEASEASYTVTVTDPNNVTTTFDFSDCTIYGYEKPASNTKRTPVEEGQTMTSGDVIITVATNGGTKTGFGTNYLGVYTGNKLTLEVKKGYVLKSIAITQADTNKSLYINDNQGKTWSGEAQYVTLSVDGKGAQIKSIAVTYTKLPTVTLSEADKDVATIIKDNNGKEVNVNLTDRTLKANVWNTFCVPFDVTLAGSALEGAAVSKVKSVDEATSTIYFEAETDKIEAGKAYLVKPETAIENPTFDAVTIKNVDPANTTGSDKYQFVGTYSPKTISEAEYGTIFGVNDANKLAKIKANTTMNGIRAYFVIPAEAAAKLNFDGETTGISTIDGDNAAATGRVYNLQGQYVGTSLDGLAKGIYVVNGKKVAK